MQGECQHFFVFGGDEDIRYLEHLVWFSLLVSSDIGVNRLQLCEIKKSYDGKDFFFSPLYYCI